MTSLFRDLCLEFYGPAQPYRVCYVQLDTLPDNLMMEALWEDPATYEMRRNIREELES